MEKLGLDPAFWQGKRVFLTGHTGFKGSWLSLWLQAWQAELKGFALAPPTEPNLFSLAEVAAGMVSELGDIREAQALRESLTSFAPEIVIHMAAQPLVRYGYAHPVETFASNVMGTVHLLEACRATPSVKVILVITSDKAYLPHLDGAAHQESDPLGGLEPYAASKACAEHVCAAYQASYFAQGHPVLASARAGNTLGGGDWATDRLIPDMIQGFLHQVPVLIRHPAAVRPWQHVLEPLSGYLLLCQRLWSEPHLAGGWNFGPQREDLKPVAWLADTLSARLSREGNAARWEQDLATNHPAETALLGLDWAKAQTELGWTPRLRLAQALDWIADWYLGWQAGEDLRALSLSQLQHYLELRS